MKLTPRQTQVTHLLLEGASTKAIADSLNISFHTAKFHIRALFNKLEVDRRGQIVVAALRAGLIQLHAPVQT